ncbi:uncharacterized protein LOC107360378 isoform X2 [Tetranychus urticae]|nr:uncharacterized protein LOC107360378 isoform X2 [Tetranychus urticae]
MSRDELTVNRRGSAGSSTDKRGSLSGISTTSSDDASSGYRSRNGSISTKKDFDDDDPEELLEAHATLKAADSLELLHQIGENATKVDDGLIDSITETNSVLPSPINSENAASKFKAKANLKVSIPTPGMRSRSGSSFGLSTPDVIPNLMEPNNGLMVTLRKLRSHESRDEFELPSADTTIYLGSDMIDLTAFPPPPATPDTAIILERTKHPLMIQEPPTPFREPIPYSNKINPFFSSLGQLINSPIAENSDTSPVVNEEDDKVNDEAALANTSDNESTSSGSPPICRDSGCQTDNGYISRDELNSDDESDSEFPFHSKPRLSMEEYEKETLEKIEQVSKTVKKMYLLEMDEASECYWQS